MQSVALKRERRRLPRSSIATWHKLEENAQSPALKNLALTEAPK
eukprot:IDg18173t1